MERIQRKGLPIKVTGMLLAVVLSVIAYVYMTGSENTPQGFRGIRWGENIQELSGLTPLAQNGDLKFYVRADDRMKLGDVALEKLVYGFYKDRFYSAMMYFDSQADFSRVKDSLSHQYGQPFQAAPSEKKLY